jgi:cell division protein FtsW
MSAESRIQERRRRRREGRLPDLDWMLLVCVATLIGLGVVMVASASMAIADRVFDAPFHFVNRHALALGMALTAGLLVFAAPVDWWQRYGTLLFFVGIALLTLVLVPGVGRSANGATRWIPLGPLNLQSSELMKFFAVVYIAGYLVRRGEEVATRLIGFIKPMLLMVVAATLIMAQPDFGTTAVLLATVLGMLFLGGVQVTHFSALFAMVGVALAALVVSSPYRMERVTSYLDPFSDPFDSGFQLSQALIAFGRGEWLGVGLGNGIQKQFYLPEAHTDFILAVVGEEFGLAGTLLIIAAFAFIVWRAFRLGMRAERLGRCFHAYLAQGFGLGLGLQALINIGVNVGLLPTKGLTLPFMSYGSNSLIVACMMVGLLLRIDLELRREAQGLVPEGAVRWARA